MKTNDSSPIDFEWDHSDDYDYYVPVYSPRNPNFNFAESTAEEINTYLASLKPDDLAAVMDSEEYLKTLSSAELADHFNTHSCTSTDGWCCDYCGAPTRAFKAKMAGGFYNSDTGKEHHQ